MEEDEIEWAISKAVEDDDAEALSRIVISNSLVGDELLARWVVWAAELGSMATLRALIEHNAGVNWKNHDDETAFSFACARDQFDAAKLLYEHGADINSVDSSGGTPLDWAVCHGRPEFRAWLKSVGGKRKMTHPEWPWPPIAREPDS